VPAGVSPADALHDAGVDALINLIESHGTYFYKTAAHPTGIIGSNDVVVIKINDQWHGQASRARTHTKLHDQLQTQPLIPVKFLCAFLKKAIWYTHRIVPY
jgi:hypothetical protein